jgi:hypothetical protein
VVKAMVVAYHASPSVAPGPSTVTPSTSTPPRVTEGLLEAGSRPPVRNPLPVTVTCEPPPVEPRIGEMAVTKTLSEARVGSTGAEVKGSQPPSIITKEAASDRTSANGTERRDMDALQDAEPSGAGALDTDGRCPVKVNLPR